MSNRNPITLFSRLSSLVIGLNLLGSGGAGALDIAFAGGQSGNPPPVHYQSNGSTLIPVDAGFHFELGTFDDFTPDENNTDEWMEHWVPINDPSGTPLLGGKVPFTRVPSFFGSFDGFKGEVVLDHNNGPFFSGAKAYIWGFDNRLAPGPGQWILLRNSFEWEFGSGTSSTEPNMTLTVGNANPIETLVGSLNGPTMTLGSVTIGGGGDPVPSITISDVSASESGGVASLVVSLSETSTSVVQVDFTTSALSASAPADFTSASGTLSVPAGTSSVTLDFLLADDGDPEVEETFEVLLSSPLGGTLAKATGTVTISDDDAPAMLEGSGGLAVNSSTGELTVSWSAVAGRDYAVLFSHDLVNWQPVTGGSVVTPSGATGSFVLPRDVLRCFFRVVDLAAGGG